MNRLNSLFEPVYFLFCVTSISVVINSNVTYTHTMTSNSDSWNNNDRWQDFSSSSPNGGFESASSGFEYPVLPAIPSGSVDMGSIAPIFGVAPTYDDEVADYLEYNKAGRPFMEQINTSCGTAYFTGIIGGGMVGGAQGFARSPSPKFKIRMNSLLNGAGMRGSKAGNALGCLGKCCVRCGEIANTDGTNCSNDVQSI